MRGNTVVDDLYIAIQKRECNKIIKKVRSGNLRLAKFPSYTSCMRIFTKDIKPRAKRGGDLKGSVSRDASAASAEHTLINRIKNFNILRTQLSQLKEEECLEKKTFADGASGYTIRNIINLEKRMGSKSRNSSIYLTTISGISGVPKTNPIVAKVMIYNTNNILETDLMTMITNSIILKSISRHFLMTYGDCVCAKRIAKKLRYMSINELADGDLKMLIEIKDVVEDTELMFNMLIQIYISIATYHNLVGFVHRDTHFGNFLYQTNSEKGYYHYTFQGKDYYLKSCKYNMMIYDYGFSKKIDSPEDAEGTIKKKEAIFNDYQKIIHAFIMRKSKGWISLTNIPSYKETNYKMIWIANMLDFYIKKELTYHTAQSSSSFAALIFSNLLQDVFLKYAPNSMFISQRPPNVINQIPFRID
jgi:hypothetical protein